MADLKIRDVYGNEFQIDASARPFWEHREGFSILDDLAPGDEPKPAGASEAAEPARPKPAAKAAVRPAIDHKE